MAIEMRLEEVEPGVGVYINRGRRRIISSKDDPDIRRLTVGDEFWLDLSGVPLFGWEDVKSLAIARIYQNRIRSGADFPPVPVARFPYGFQLVPYAVNEFGLTDGGHHRAVAHYIEGKPLNCRLVPNEGPVAGKIEIKGIRLTGDFEGFFR